MGLMREIEMCGMLILKPECQLTVLQGRVALEGLQVMY